jgi:hypothetical protein
MNALNRVTYFLAGLIPIFPALSSLPLIGSVPYVYLAIFLPATIVGFLYLTMKPSLWIIVPVLVIVFPMFFGIFWSVDGRGRGLLVFAAMIIAAPLAALISSQERWTIAAQSFAFGSSLSAIYLFADWTTQGVKRYGALFSESGTRTADPNTTAIHLSFAMILMVILALRSLSSTGRVLPPITVITVPVLFSGVIMTGSRGALLAVGIALLTLFLFSIGGANRAWKLYLLGYASACSLFLLFVVPNGLRDRLLQENLLTLGDRLPIWRTAAEAVQDGSVRTLILGAGTGAADRVLGEANPYSIVANLGDDGVYRLNAHNAYIDWFLSHGLLGVAMVMTSAALFFYCARRVDCERGYAGGLTLIVFLMVVSLSLIVYRLQATSIVMIAITLGYVTGAEIPDTRLRKSSRHQVRRYRDRLGARE